MSKLKHLSKIKKDEFKPLMKILKRSEESDKGYRNAGVMDKIQVKAKPYTFLDLERSLENLNKTTSLVLKEIKSFNHIDKSITASEKEEAITIAKGLLSILKGVVQSINTISPDMDFIRFTKVCDDSELV